jgi:hypothetical protein
MFSEEHTSADTEVSQGGNLGILELPMALRVKCVLVWFVGRQYAGRKAWLGPVPEYSQ